jgi:hypothetical protein
MRVKLPRFSQQHGRDSGELLADRADLEPGLWCAHHAGPGVGQPARRFQPDLAGAGDRRRPAQALDRLHTPSLAAPDPAGHESDLAIQPCNARALPRLIQWPQASFLMAVSRVIV